MWENGADIVKDGKPALSSPESVSALKTWTDLVKNDKISPVGLSGAESDKLFETSKAAMEITGPWATSGYDKDGFSYDVAPIPAGPAGAFTLADTVVLMVNAKTQNKDAALQFIKHWNSKDSQVTLSSMTGFPPTRTDLANDPTLGHEQVGTEVRLRCPSVQVLPAGPRKVLADRYRRVRADDPVDHSR